MQEDMNIAATVGNSLLESGGVHFLQDHHEFAYSDGDVAEAYVLEAIKQSSDLSSESLELESKARDWVSRYHLSRSRSLAYRALNITSATRILEVGSGCGSITRYLGERAGWVLALEGSARRAAITRERTRDQSNVSVLCASFENVAFRQPFDLVVCNGVLEYASMFIAGNNPAERMMGALSSLLSRGGVLVIAIENKLGMRYFSSSREEHTNILFDGIEGYRRFPRGPRTFGNRELRSLLQRHFSKIQFLLPLPDYKLPSAVVREELLKEVDCSELFANMCGAPSSTPVPPLMHERLVWHELQKNDLLLDFANSYFVVAARSPSTWLDPAWLGDIYAINRVPGLQVHTRIVKNGYGRVETTKSYFATTGIPFNPLAHHRLETSAWVSGISVHTLMSAAMLSCCRSTLSERMRPVIGQWWDAVVDFAERVAKGRLGGAAMDLNWENSILSQGKIRFIDTEWVLRDPIDTHWFLYRVITKFLEAEWRYRSRWSSSCRGASKLQLLIAAGAVLDIPWSLKDLWRAILRETAFQKTIVARARKPWRLLIEDCAPFRLIHAWKNAALAARAFRARVHRNFRRVNIRRH